jgi:hypothetical protein
MKMFDAIVVIRCRKDQVLEIIEHLKSRFKNVDVSYEVVTTEL